MLRAEGPRAGWSAAAQWSWTSTVPAAPGLGSDPSCSTHAALLTYHWSFCCIKSTMFTCYHNTGVHMLSQHRQTHRQINLCESIQQTKNPLIIRPTNQQNIHLSTYISVYPNKKPRFICLTNQPYKTTIPSCVLLTIQLSIHKNICPTN